MAHGDVVSLSGKLTHLGHVIAGFKYGCNKLYWAMTGKMNLATESPGTLAFNVDSRIKDCGETVCVLKTRWKSFRSQEQRVNKAMESAEKAPNLIKFIP